MKKWIAFGLYFVGGIAVILTGEIQAIAGLIVAAFALTYLHIGGACNH